MAKITISPNSQKNWENDAIQFPRLLAEIAGGIELTGEQEAWLCNSMDISLEELNQLFDRAQRVWDDIVQRTGRLVK